MAFNTDNDIAILNDTLGTGFKYSEAQGAYKGVKETSLVITYESDSQLKTLIDLGIAYKQESILILDENRAASLLMLGSNELIPLGSFQAVEKSMALQSDAYTYMPNLDQYYIVS